MFRLDMHCLTSLHLQRVTGSVELVDLAMNFQLSIFPLLSLVCVVSGSVFFPCHNSGWGQLCWALQQR